MPCARLPFFGVGLVLAGVFRGTMLRFATSRGGWPTVWLALALAVGAPSAAASASGAIFRASPQQENAGAIEGTVRDPRGTAIAGATVHLKGADRSEAAEAKTDSQGRFVFSARAAGRYSLEVQMPGFSSLVVKGVNLERGERKQLSLTMEISPTGEGHAEALGQQSAGKMEFDDKPDFTIAGITDWSDAGLHGSAANARTSDALNKDTLALKAAPAGAAPGSTAAKSGEAAASERVREAEAHRAAGDRAEKAGDPLTAVREYEDATRLDASEQNYFDWGTELLLHKAAIPSAEVFRRGASAHPESARLRAAMGAALYASGSYDEAAQMACEASDLKPDEASFYLLLGEMEKAAAGPLPCAEEKLRRFAREEPHDARANYLYALAIWKTERVADNASAWQESKELLEKAVRLNPKLGEAYVQLGILYETQGRAAQGVDAYKKAIEANAELGEAHYRLSLAYKRIGEAARAQQEYQAYEQIQKTEVAARESERQKLRQFLVVMKGQQSNGAPK